MRKTLSTLLAAIAVTTLVAALAGGQKSDRADKVPEGAGAEPPEASCRIVFALGDLAVSVAEPDGIDKHPIPETGHPYIHQPVKVWRFADHDARIALSHFAGLGETDAKTMAKWRGRNEPRKLAGRKALERSYTLEGKRESELYVALGAGNGLLLLSLSLPKDLSKVHETETRERFRILLESLEINPLEKTEAEKTKPGSPPPPCG